jgi:hypothetical protein
MAQPSFALLDAAALALVHGGYPDAMFAEMKNAVGMGLTVNSTWTGQHGSSPAGQAHYQGRAFDAIGTQEQMWSFYHHLVDKTNAREVIFRDKHILDGKSVAPMPGHYTHIHAGW